MTGESFKVEMRELKCPNDNGSLMKNGFTKNGHYQRYRCKTCKYDWVELVPPRQAILRGFYKGYDN